MSLQDLMDSDLDNLFFNTDDFAVEAVYTPKAGEAYTIKGYFDREFKDVNPGGEIAVISNTPRFRTAEKSLKAAPGPGDRLTVNNVVYSIKEPQPDGTGIIDLYLHRT